MTGGRGVRGGWRTWFGPHRIGFGWGPVRWQGWVITVAAAAVAVAVVQLVVWWVLTGGRR